MWHAELGADDADNDYAEHADASVHSKPYYMWLCGLGLRHYSLLDNLRGAAGEYIAGWNARGAGAIPTAKQKF